ncbi:RagB/SusD family nutrient uptake outer membrane protein, partial [Bacteroides uniformis]
VVTWLEDCIANSGHQLVGDFRNLWAYTNEYTVDDYAYTAGVTGVDGQPLRWAGNGNAEAVFAVKFGNFAGYSYENQGGYCNLYLSFFGIMSKSDNGAAFPFGNTNSFGTVPTSLWDSWEAAEPDDIRRRASVIVDEDEFDMANYESGEVRQQWEETGLWNKKLQPILSKQAYDKMGSWGNSLFWIAHPEFAGMNDPYIQPRWAAMFEDLYIIRFADVLLMHSELTGNADNMNRVRARAGLPAIGYSLEALQQERRHELAFEGQRFQDIRRWHIAETELNKQNNTTLKNLGVSTVMRDGKYAARYQATGGFWPIPPAQIQLSDGVLTQNPGWDTPDARYTTWNFD